jgi:VWFA-related protein
MRIRFAPLLLLPFAANLAAKPPAAPAQPTFGATVEVNVVNVEVVATDRDGRRVSGLKKEDFTVFEDGKPVAITNFAVAASRDASQASEAAPAPTAGAAAAAEEAWNLVVFFDNSNLRPASRGRALRQLRDFLAGLAPGDRVLLATLDLGLHVRVPFTEDRAALQKALQEIERLSARGFESDLDRRQTFAATMTIQEQSINSPDPLPCPQNIVTPAHSYASLRRQEVLRSVGALTLLVNSLSGVPGRKAVLYVGDGLPLQPGEEVFQLLIEICGGGGTAGLNRIGIAGLQETVDQQPEGAAGGFPKPRPGVDIDPYQVFDAREIGPRAYQAASQGPLDAQSYSVVKELQTLAAHANAQRVTLYTLQASGLAGPDAADPTLGPADRLFRFPSIGTVLRANSRDSLQLLADTTGGRSILDTNDFLPDLARMREDFESSYSLGYTPAHSGDGREHRIEVRVDKPGIRLRYRRSYRDKPALEKLVDRTLAALLYGMEDNPLEVQVEVGEMLPGGPAGSWTVPLRLKIPLFKLAILNRDETFEGQLRVFVATRTPDGGNSPVRQVEVPIRIPRKQVLRAMGQFYLYTLTLQLKPGEQQVAVAVRDELAATTSFLSRGLTIGDPEGRAALPNP